MANFQDSPCYSPRFVAALGYAADIHSHQIRKQGNVPYLSHLLQVAGMVMEAGGSEDECIAALLHDAVEDVEIPIDDLYQWGSDVRWMVAQLSEPKTMPKEHRKGYYIDKVMRSSGEVILISCADKLHNLRSYATDGRHLWKDDTAQFYDQLMPIYEGCDRVPCHWIEEMRRLLTGLKQEMVCIPKQDHDWLMQGYP